MLASRQSWARLCLLVLILAGLILLAVIVITRPCPDHTSPSATPCSEHPQPTPTTARPLVDSEQAVAWQPINVGLPGYASVTGIVALPAATGRQMDIVVSTYDRAGIYKSDGGASWRVSDAGLAGASVFTLAQDPRNPRVLYAGSVAGVYRSTDEGASWHHLGDIVQPVYALLFDRQQPGVVYAGALGAVLRSSDGGTTWARYEDGLSDVSVLALAEAGTANVLYAGTNGGGIMRSSDGMAWVSVYPTTTVISCLVTDPFSRNHLLARAQDTLLRSRDGGETWRPMTPGPPGRPLGIVFDPAEQDAVYALTARQGVQVSRDGGETWQTLGHGLAGHAVYALAIPGSGPYRLLAATVHGIWALTADNTWITLGQPVGPPIVRTLAFSPEGQLVVGTTDGLFRREGDAWQRVGAGLGDVHVLALAFDQHDAQRMHVGTWGNGIQISTDGGNTWEQTTERPFANIMVPRVVVDPGDAATVYARVEYARLLISRDSGETWRETSLPITVTVFSIAPAPSDSSRVYAGTDRGVHRSLDRGEHWQALLGPPAADSILALAVDPHDANTVYAGSEAGLHRSFDGGTTWEQATGLNDMTVTALLVDGTSTSTLYAGTRYHGVFASTDRGATWVRLAPGLDDGRINALDRDPRSGALYAGTETGVYVLPRPMVAAVHQPPATPMPTATRAAIAPHQTPVFAMHTLRADGRLVSLVREARFDAIVQVIAWREVEPEKGQYTWEFPDAVVRAAEFYDLVPIFRVDFQPLWARNTWTNAPPERLEDYGDFVHALAKRYRGRVAGYIVWNEPNLAHEWGGMRPDPAAYAALLKVAYQQIKHADPAALVVSAGLAPTNEQSDQAMDDRAFLRGLYAAGATAYFDVLGAHAYGFGYPPDDQRNDHDGLNLARLQDLRDIMEANGDEGKPVWITEFGWPTESTDPAHAWQVVTEKQQAAYLVRAYEKAAQDWPWVELLAVWNLSVGLDVDDQMRGYSIVNDDYSPKPAYHALQRLAQRRAPQDEPQGGQAQPAVEILARDVVVHLGDQDYLVWPWVHVYQRIVPATVWSGEFFVQDVGTNDWTLTLDGFQLNEWGNRVEINDRPLEPRFLPGRINDWAGYWTRVHFRVPAEILRCGLNRFAIYTSMNAPVHQAHAVSWEDLQVRNIVLRPQPP